MSPLDPLAMEFINRFQGGLPLAGRPYLLVAAELGTTEATLIQTARDLLAQGLLSRLGPLYDVERLHGPQGPGALTLAALAVPEARFEAVAAEVNALPQVAHNYRRDHRLNMWFVIAAESARERDEALETIARRTRLAVYDFPRRRTFYLGLRLVLHADGAIDTVSVPPAGEAAPQRLDELDRRLIGLTQAGLALVPEPYARLAGEAGCDTPTVLARLRAMLVSGLIRRIGAVPNHYRLGLRGNGMSVWDVPDDRLAAAGAAVGSLGFVSHCYERPRRPPVWPYNLFAMVHGADRAAVRDKVARIRELLGPAVRRHDILFSEAVLKKTGFRRAA